MLSLGFWALGLRALGSRHEASGLPGLRGRGFSLLLSWIRGTRVSGCGGRRGSGLKEQQETKPWQRPRLHT